MATEQQAVEKRRYYRINDVVGLTYSVINGAEEQHAKESTYPDKQLVDVVAELDTEFNRATNILWHESPTVAKAIGLLNKKVSMMAEHRLSENNKDQSTFSNEDLPVNISGCGIAFHSEEQLTTQTRLNLKAQLKPSNITLCLTGIVIACEHAQSKTETGYWVRIEFDENNDAAQEQLIQHIVQKQCVQLQGNELRSTPG